MKIIKNIGFYIKKFGIVIPFIPLIFAEIYTHIELISFILSFFSIFSIIYRLNMPKILFRETNHIPNILTSFAVGLVSLAFILPDYGILIGICSFILVVTGGSIIARNLPHEKKSHKKYYDIGEKILKSVKDIKGKFLYKFLKTLLVCDVLIFTYIACIIFTILILSLHRFYIYLFVALLIWLTYDAYVEKKKIRKSIVDGIEETDHFEGNILKMYISQPLTIRGATYFILLLYYFIYAFLGAVFGLVPIIAFLNGETSVPTVYSKIFPLPELSILIFLIITFFYFITLAFLYIYPIYFIRKLLELYTKKGNSKKPIVYIMPKSIWCLSFLVITNLSYIPYPYNEYVFTLVPIFNFFLIIIVVLKEKEKYSKNKKKNLNQLTSKIENMGTAILILNIVLLFISTTLFPITKYSDGAKQGMITFFVFGLFLIFMIKLLNLIINPKKSEKK